MLEHRGLAEERQECLPLPLMIRALGDHHAVEERGERLRVPAPELRPLLPGAKVAGGERSATLLKPRPSIAWSDLAVDLHQVPADLIVANDPFATRNVGVVHGREIVASKIADHSAVFGSTPEKTTRSVRRLSPFHGFPDACRPYSSARSTS